MYHVEVKRLEANLVQLSCEYQISVRYLLSESHNQAGKLFASFLDLGVRRFLKFKFSSQCHFSMFPAQSANNCS